MARPKKYTDKWIRNEAEALLSYAKATAIPFEKEFASERGYSSQRISEFAKKSEEFSEALKKMKDIQEVKIVKAALFRKINTTMAIFTLKNVAGWRDGLAVERPEDRERTILTLVTTAPEEETAQEEAKVILNTSEGELIR